MPREARWLIKTALLYLALALLAGTAAALFSAAPRAGALHPTVLHLLTVGWLVQLAFGVAFWLFPRYTREQPYGRRWPVWTAYVLLNAGLLLRAVAEPLGSAAPSGRQALIASALLQWLGGVLFVVYLWPRVKRK